MIYVFFCSDIEFREFNIGFIVIAALFLIISIINIFYYVTMIKYIQKLKIDKCDCSKMWERKMMYIVSIIGLVFGSILLFLYLVPPLVILILRLE
jgi:NADH:ubiquinone oxidoreductase subunit 2 (subunit N)